MFDGGRRINGLAISPEHDGPAENGPMVLAVKSHLSTPPVDNPVHSRTAASAEPLPLLRFRHLPVRSVRE